jgi:hypothetical protein
MASIGLNMKFTASTGGLQQGVANAGKSLSQLSSIISQSSQVFQTFAGDNAAAAVAQQKLATDTAFLASALKTGQISAKQFEEEAAALATEANALASAFTQGATVTAQFRTEQEKQADEMARLQSLLDAGAISQETYSRAVLDVSGVTKSVAEAEAQRAKVLADGASVTQKYATEQERQAAEMARLQSLLDAGAISQETYSRAVYETSGAAKEEADALAATAKAQDRAAAIVRKSMTAEEQHAEQLEELNQLFSEGYLDATQYGKAQERLAQQFNKVEKEVEQTESTLKKMAGSLRALVAIEVGRILVDVFSSIGRTVSQAVSRIVAMTDATAKLAKQTGIAVEELQVFQLAAQMSGVDNLVEPIRKLGIEIGNAAQTGNIEKFERLGLNFQQLSALAPEDQFKTIASAISALPGPAERAAAAVAIFGEQGVKLLPLFESNLAAIEERMQRLGAVLSEEQTGAIEEMNDALTLVQAAFDGIIGQVTANLAPIVTAMAEDLLTFIESYGGLGEGTGGTALADSITEALFDGAEYLAGVFDYVVAQLSDWGVSFSGAVETMAAVFDIFGRAVAFIEAVFLAYRSFFLEYLALLSSALEQIIGFFSSSAAEFLNNFSEELRRNAAQDREGATNASQRAFGEGQRASAGPGMASGWVAEGRQRFENRNSPEAEAEREAKRAERAAQRQAAVDAANAAKEQKRIEDEQKRAAEEQKKIEERRLQDIGRLNEQYAEKSTEIEASRLDTLSRANQNALEASDIRSGGISQFLALATGREDPAVAEARAQRQELEKIAAEIRKLGGTVELVGAA